MQKRNNFLGVITKLFIVLIISLSVFASDLSPGDISYVETDKITYEFREGGTISWSEADNATDYDIEIYDRSTSELVARGNYRGMTYCNNLIGGLAPGEYKVVVWGKNGNKKGGSAETTFSIEEILEVEPDRITSLRTDKSSYEEGETIIISWDTAKNALDYEYEIYDKFTLELVASANCPIGNVRFTKDLSPGDYEFVVWGRNGKIKGQSAEVSFTVLGYRRDVKPGKITSLDTDKYTYEVGEDITISWDKASNAMACMVEIYNEDTSKLESSSRSYSTSFETRVPVGEYEVVVYAYGGKTEKKKANPPRLIFPL